MTAAPGGTESDFRAHLAQAVREKRDAAVDDAAQEVRDAARRARGSGSVAPNRSVEREKSQASQQTMSSALSVGGSLLGALFGGRRRSSVFDKAASAARSVGRIGKERTDVTQAEADVDRAARAVCRARDGTRGRDRVARIDVRCRAIAEVESVAVKPRKSDIAVDRTRARLAARLT